MGIVIGFKVFNFVILKGNSFLYKIINFLVSLDKVIFNRVVVWY